MLIIVLFLRGEDKKNLLEMGVQFTAGVTTGCVSTYTLFKIFPPEYESGDIVKIDETQMILNTTIGLIFGSHFGVIISGKIMKRKGDETKSFFGSLLGFLCGTGSFAYFFETFKGTKYETLGLIPLFILPSFGSTFGYNFDSFLKGDEK